MKIAGSLLIANFLLGAIVMYARSLPVAEVVPFLLVSLASSAALALTYGVIAYRTSMRYMGFVRLAEGIFQIFGWPNVEDIDLPAITKKNKKLGDAGALGILFFRY